MKSCPYCAEQIQDEAIVCRFCQRSLVGPQAGQGPASTVVTIAREPRPGIAAVLSLVIPGAGQMYMGRPVAGIVWLLATLVGYALLIVPGLLLHICCIVNAATVSRATTALAALPPSPSGFWLCPSCGKRARGPRFCQQCGASMAGATPALP